MTNVGHDGENKMDSQGEGSVARLRISWLREILRFSQDEQAVGGLPHSHVGGPLAERLHPIFYSLCALRHQISGGRSVIMKKSREDLIPQGLRNTQVERP